MTGMRTLMKLCVIGKTRGSGVFTPTDPDAAAFVTAAGITDNTQKHAIDTLVLSLKSASLWTTAQAIYPIVGGTAAAHKWNLKNPLDTDGAFRLTFTGTVTHASTGMTGNGTTGFANTHFNPSVNYAASTGTIGVYSRTDVGATSTDIGVLAGGIANSVACRHPTKAAYGFNSGAILSGGTNPSSAFCAVNQPGTGVQAYRNGALDVSNATGGARANGDVYIMARNNAATADEFSTREIAFAWIGETLAAPDHAALYSAIQTYQTTLGRQV